MTFCNEIGLLQRDMGVSRIDLYETDTTSDDIFASVPYVYDKVQNDRLSDCRMQQTILLLRVLVTFCLIAGQLTYTQLVQFHPEVIVNSSIM